jgi:hypothetical protein
MTPRFASLGALICAALVRPLPCDACQSAQPINYFVFAEPLPAPGSVDVPRDPTLILRGRVYALGGSPIILSWFEVESVSMTDSDGQAIAGHIQARDFSDTEPMVSWVPDEMLAANAEYHVAATLASQAYPRPAEAEGSETLEFSFTTGEQVTPELELGGPLAVSVKATTLPVEQCTPAEECGQYDCVTVGERDALVAEVAVPAARGGSDAEGFQGYVILTDTAPVSFNGPGGTTDNAELVFEDQSIRLSPGVALQTEIELPGKGEPYVPCFSLNVWDPGGKNVTLAPVCLDAVEPPEPEDQVEATGGATGAAGAPGIAGAPGSGGGSDAGEIAAGAGGEPKTGGGASGGQNQAVKDGGPDSTRDGGSWSGEKDSGVGGQVPSDNEGDARSDAGAPQSGSRDARPGDQSTPAAGARGSERSEANESGCACVVGRARPRRALGAGALLGLLAVAVGRGRRRR